MPDKKDKATKQKAAAEEEIKSLEARAVGKSRIGKAIVDAYLEGYMQACEQFGIL